MFYLKFFVHIIHSAQNSPISFFPDSFRLFKIQFRYLPEEEISELNLIVTYLRKIIIVKVLECFKDPAKECK